MSDPASLEVEVVFRGLSADEAGVTFNAIPPSAKLSAEISPQAIGGLRYSMHVTNLSILGASELTEAVLQYLQACQMEQKPEWNVTSHKESGV